MTDTEWTKIQHTIHQLWPAWVPTAGHTSEYRYRLANRPYATVERAIRDHFAKDECPFQPALSRILAHCVSIAESSGNQSKAAGITYEAREQMRLSDLDDAVALDTIRKWTPERLEAAIEVAVASQCVQDIPRSDPEAWTKNERGFIVAADWMIETQPSKARTMLANHAKR